MAQFSRIRFTPVGKGQHVLARDTILLQYPQYGCIPVEMVSEVRVDAANCLCKKERTLLSGAVQTAEIHRQKSVKRRVDSESHK